MRKVVLGTFLTLDGVMQAPGGPEEDTSGGFKYGGWQGPYWDADAQKFISEQIAATEGLLLGRVTYQIFANYWPTAPADDLIGQKLNSISKYVWSTTLDKVEWNNSRLIKGDMAEEVTKLKRQPGSGILSVIGSGRLAQSLMRLGLVDEYTLWIHSLVLGSGKRLFPEGINPLKLRLVGTKTFGSGIVLLTYQPERGA